MSDLESILSSAQGGQLTANLADRFGLTEEQIQGAVRALAPALAIGLNRAAEEPELFERTVGALSTTARYSFFDEPGAAHSDESVELGREMLTEFFGSPAATGQVLQAAARESGVRPDILGQILPILVSVLLSGLTKTINEKGLGGVLGQLANSGALGGLLEQILKGGGGAPPAPAPRGNGGGSGGGRLGGVLGGLLGGLLGPLLRGGRGPAPGGSGPHERADPLDTDRGDPPGAPGLPSGLDQASVQQAIEEIKKTLNIGRAAEGAKSAGQAPSDLEKLLGEILGKR